MFLYVIIAVIAVILLYLFIAYNGLVGARNRVKEAFATMDVYLKKRWDLIPNLVETVKGYAAHEKETLERIVSLRSVTYEKLTPDEKIAEGAKLSGAIGNLFAIAEQYPDLKANTNFMQLSGELSSAEKDIANARKYYNAIVREYNNRVEMFPGNVVAGLFGFRASAMFETQESEKANVKVNFGEGK